MGLQKLQLSNLARNQAHELLAGANWAHESRLSAPARNTEDVAVLASDGRAVRVAELHANLAAWRLPCGTRQPRQQLLYLRKWRYLPSTSLHRIGTPRHTSLSLA